MEAEVTPVTSSVTLPVLSPGQPFPVGAVIVTAGGKRSVVSWIIRLVTGSWWTHVILVTGNDRAVEAVLPRVTTCTVSERIAELAAEGRAYAVLDDVTIPPEVRAAIAAKAESYVGRWYDLWNAAFYAVFGWWREDGYQTMVCSRLVTASYFRGAERVLFHTPIAGLSAARCDQLADGYCTPAELLLVSALPIVGGSSPDVLTLRTTPTPTALPLPLPLPVPTP